MVARIWKTGSGTENDEKTLNKYSRKRFVDIGLENAAVAAARVTDRPSRSSLKGVRKRRCLQNVCENFFGHGIKGELGRRIGASTNRRENPHSKLCLGNIYIYIYVYIYIYIYMPRN